MKKPVLLEGKPLARRLNAETKAAVLELRDRGIEVGLALVIVGEEHASRQYFESTGAICRRLGIKDIQYRLPETSSVNEILQLVKSLNGDDRVSGILVFLPLPKQIDQSQRMMLNAVSPEKDVDGLGAISIGRMAAEESTYQLFKSDNSRSSIALKGVRDTFLPCTPYGVMMLLEHYGIEIAGKDVVIVGKSLTVGKSLALMALAKNATVTVCHKGTRELASKTKTADVLFAAAGKPNLITADMVKEGAIVVDIGISVLPDGRVVGDVEFEGVSQVASHITPVPGGVGPVTIAILLKNTVLSAKRMFHVL